MTETNGEPALPAAAQQLVTAPGRQDAPREDELIERVVAGDRGAFEALYRLHAGRVYALCLRMTGNPAEAEECTQAVFVRAWQKLAGFEGRSALSSWLHRVAVNEVLAQRRREGRRGPHLELVQDGSTPAESDPRPTNSGVELDLERALQTLPEGARQVFVLYAVYGYTHEEAAATLGVAVGTCKAQLHRARKLLRTRLSSE